MVAMKMSGGAAVLRRFDGAKRSGKKTEATVPCLDSFSKMSEGRFGQEVTPWPAVTYCCRFWLVYLLQKGCGGIDLPYYQVALASNACVGWATRWWRGFLGLVFGAEFTRVEPC